MCRFFSPKICRFDAALFFLHPCRLFLSFFVTPPPPDEIYRYDGVVAPYVYTVLYVACSVAIFCVFKYESAFHRELDPLDPYWKFFGVKGVVSVTSFQWAIIRFKKGCVKRLEWGGAKRLQ